MKFRHILSSVAVMAAGFASGAQATAVTGVHGAQSTFSEWLVPPGMAFGRALASTVGGAQVEGYGVTYQGGPVMNAKTGINVYLIWYGDWAAQGGPGAKAIIQDMLTLVGGTPYWAINTTYYQKSDRPKNRVTTKVNLAGQIDDVAKSLGDSLTNSGIKALVRNALSAGSLPADPNGVYFVLTAKDVNNAGFCTRFCAWHGHASLLSTNIKYAFVGDPSRCANTCFSPNRSTSPNSNPGADAMAPLIIHELVEAATDPDFNGWGDLTTGEEVADKCVGKYGATYDPGNGSLANVKWGSRDFLIEQIWVNQPPAGRCDLDLEP